MSNKNKLAKLLSIVAESNNYNQRTSALNELSEMADRGNNDALVALLSVAKDCADRNLRSKALKTIIDIGNESMTERIADMLSLIAIECDYVDQRSDSITALANMSGSGIQDAADSLLLVGFDSHYRDSAMLAFSKILSQGKRGNRVMINPLRVIVVKSDEIALYEQALEILGGLARNGSAEANSALKRIADTCQRQDRKEAARLILEDIARTGSAGDQGATNNTTAKATADSSQISYDMAVRQKLCDLLKVEGVSLCQDRARCRALLYDCAGSHRKEIFILMTALEGGVVDELINRQERVSLPPLMTRLEDMLVENFGLTPESVKWAVESWAAALQLS